MIKTFVIDDHPLIREGLKQILCEASDISVEGEASIGVEALNKVEENLFDVVTLHTYSIGKRDLDFLRKLGYSLKIITVMDNERIVSALPMIVFKKLKFKAFFYIPLVGYDSIIHLPNVNKTKQILEEFVKMTTER